jgi:hypothetical protein
MFDTAKVRSADAPRERSTRASKAHGCRASLSLLAAIAATQFGSPAAVFADKESDVAALEARCEADRETKLKPLRDAEIAKCKEDVHNPAGFCESFWKDYGNATRTRNGTMVPRMFDDLPSCAAAYKARMALIND